MYTNNVLLLSTTSVVAVVAEETGGGTFISTKSGPITMPPPIPQRAANAPAIRLMRESANACSWKSISNSSTFSCELSHCAKYREQQPRKAAMAKVTVHHDQVHSGKKTPFTRISAKTRSQRPSKHHFAIWLRCKIFSAFGSSDTCSTTVVFSGFPSTFFSASASFAVMLCASLRLFRAESNKTMSSNTSVKAGGANACSTLPTWAPAMRPVPITTASSKLISGLCGLPGKEPLQLYKNAAIAPPDSMA
mmetsp:Transcript_122784/g.191689  ORF Transcript_122784/g.191689 Transcript_122784/m.191689 type:complete len:249 (+) Transcript_122784:326-1072(+)